MLKPMPLYRWNWGTSTNCKRRPPPMMWARSSYEIVLSLTWWSKVNRNQMSEANYCNIFLDCLHDCSCSGGRNFPRAGITCAAMPGVETLCFTPHSVFWKLLSSLILPKHLPLQPTLAEIRPHVACDTGYSLYWHSYPSHFKCFLYLLLINGMRIQ